MSRKTYKRTRDIRERSKVSPAMRICVFLFNTLFWLLGSMLVGAGIWAFAEKNWMGVGGVDFISMQNKYASVFSIVFDLTLLVIVLGMIIFVLAFAGCIGALRENICLLKTFAYVMGMLLLIETVLALLAFVFSKEIKSKVTEVFQVQGLIRYRDDVDFRNLIDWTQQTFHCCGVGIDGYKDWSFNPYFNCTPDNPSFEKCSVPFSCCVTANDVEVALLNTRCGYRTQELSEPEARQLIFTTGCIEGVMSLCEQNLLIIGVVGLGLVVVQVFGILLVLSLSRQIADVRTQWT